jgi:hypothetical protein
MPAAATVSVHLPGGGCVQYESVLPCGVPCCVDGISSRALVGFGRRLRERRRRDVCGRFLPADFPWLVGSLQWIALAARLGMCRRSVLPSAKSAEPSRRRVWLARGQPPGRSLGSILPRTQLCHCAGVVADRLGVSPCGARSASIAAPIAVLKSSASGPGAVPWIAVMSIDAIWPASPEPSFGSSVTSSQSWSMVAAAVAW